MGGGGSLSYWGSTVFTIKIKIAQPMSVNCEILIFKEQCHDKKQKLVVLAGLESRPLNPKSIGHH